MPRMVTWTYNLSQITDPIKRSGLLGLERLLRYGEHDDRYPGVRRTENLDWELTDTTVTLRFRSGADLIPLMVFALGDFRDGIAVFPGYEGDPGAPGFYVSGRDHLATCGLLYRARRGWARTESLTLPSDKNSRQYKAKVAKIETWRERFGHEPVTKIDNLMRPAWGKADPEPLEVKVSPHMLNEDAPPADLFTAATGKLKKRVELKTVFHPAYAKLNDVQLSGTPQDAFIVYFACLSYAYVTCRHRDKNKTVTHCAGIALDADTFSETDKLHRRWSCSADDTRVVIGVPNDGVTGCWFIAAALELPVRVYSALTPTGPMLFSPHTPHCDQQAVYKALQGAMVPADTVGLLWRGSHVPTKPKAEKTNSYVTSILVRNVTSGAPWHLDLEGVVTLVRERKDGTTQLGLYRREQEILTHIYNTLGGPMEKKIVSRMNRLFHSLVWHYLEHFYGGEQTDQNWEKARRKAVSFAVNVRLNRAFHRSSILDAINEIRAEAGTQVRFSDEELDWLIERAAKTPRDVRSLLILACGGVKLPKTGAKQPQADPGGDVGEEPDESSETDVDDPDDAEGAISFQQETTNV